MKPYVVTITPRNGPTRSYCARFAHVIDAWLHGLETCADPEARVSAKPLTLVAV